MTHSFGPRMISEFVALLRECNHLALFAKWISKTPA